MASFIDDKAPICIPFLLDVLASHRATLPNDPLVVGLNGIQGVGKTTLVSLLTSALQEHGINAVVCSIDDFYLKHDDQLALAAANPDNALLQQRGEPGTHDVGLATAVLSALASGRPTTIPKYDKAAFSGQGDQLPPSTWTPVNQPDCQPIDVIILEGWCVGFRSIEPSEVEAKQKAPSRTLQSHPLAHLQLVNEKLAAYKPLTDLFAAFIQIDSEDTEYVYNWRWEQEENMRCDRGDPSIGMNHEQVIAFVDGYYPAYELYTDGIRQRLFPDQSNRQLRLIVGRDRRVKEVIKM